MDLRLLLLTVVVSALVDQSCAWWWRKRCNRRDCVLANWGPWSPCASGRSTRFREVLSSPSCGGTRCFGITKQVKRCCEKADCVWADWGSWTNCSLTAHTQYRFRTKVTMEQCGGQCVGQYYESRQCACHRQNCLWREWGPWTSCTQGNQSRARSKVTTESCGGTCSGSNVETSSCINSGHCGLSKVPPRLEPGPPTRPFLQVREVSPAGKWPWAVSMQTNNGSHLCSGTLVSAHWVVTSAQCVPQSLQPSSVEVVAGLHDVSSQSSTTQRRTVARVIRHPSFLAMSNPRLTLHDIALVELSSPVTFSTYIQPVCITDSKDGFTDCSAAGWNYRNFTELHEVPATIASKDECEKTMGSWVTSGGLFCVSKEASSLLCEGDAGGPLMCQAAETGQFALAGVASHALDGCAATPGTNSAYTDVVKYTSWIKQQCGDCV